MRARPQPSDDIDLSMLWQVVRGSLRRLIPLAVIGGALTWGGLMMIAPRYTSEAELAIVAKGTTNPYADPARGGGISDAVTVRMDKEAINTHVRALNSPDLASKIATDLKLAERVEFNSELGSPDTMTALLRFLGIGAPRAGESEQDRVLNTFFSRLEVYSPKESRFIGIRFTSMDPELSAEVANALAETYRTTLATQGVIETDEVQRALEPKIAKLTQEVADAEAEVERFRGEANIFKGGQQATGLNEQQLAELTAELTKAKSARSDAEARTSSAREMMKVGSADTLPDVQKSPLIQNLVQQRVRVERQISELSATLLPAHPRMRQLKADLAGLKRQIDAEVVKVVDGLAKEAKVAALREESVTKSLNEIKQRVVTTGPDEAKLRSLEANVKSKRAELDRLQSQYESNRVRADSRAIPVEAQIVANARPSSVVAYPKKRGYVLLVMSAILLFGLALAITRALVQGVRPQVVPPRRGSRVEMPEPDDMPRPIAPRQIEGPRYEPEPQSVPVAAEPPAAEPSVAVEPRVVTMTSIGDVAARLEALKEPGSGGVRTLLAGETEGFGPGAEVAELAKTLEARGHSVLVIDWGVEDPSADAKRVGRPGIGELVADKAKFEDVIGNFPNSEVHFIPVGQTSVDELSSVEPDRVNVLLDALDEVYDHILVAARREPARLLFEAIQGRFDAGLTVGAPGSGPDGAHELETFLGFEVDGIELMRLERDEPRAKPGLRFGRRDKSKSEMHAL